MKALARWEIACGDFERARKTQKKICPARKANLDNPE
jgi:hypothetical protein